MGAIHFIIQGKGGVGKSVIASLLYQTVKEFLGGKAAILICGGHAKTFSGPPGFIEQIQVHDAVFDDCRRAFGDTQRLCIYP